MKKSNKLEASWPPSPSSGLLYEGSSVNRKQETRMEEQSWSWCGLTHHWSFMLFRVSLPARWFDKCQNCRKSLLGRQILPQAGSSTLVFPFPRMILLEEFPVPQDNCFSRLTAKVRGTRVCLFSVSAPARTVTGRKSSKPYLLSWL